MPHKSNFWITTSKGQNLIQKICILYAHTLQGFSSFFAKFLEISNDFSKLPLMCPAQVIFTKKKMNEIYLFIFQQQK